MVQEVRFQVDCLAWSQRLFAAVLVTEQRFYAWPIPSF